MGNVNGKCKSCDPSHSSSGNSQVWDPKDLPGPPAAGAKPRKWQQKAKFSRVLIDLNVGDMVVDVKKLDKKSNALILVGPLGTAGIRG